MLVLFLRTFPGRGSLSLLFVAACVVLTATGCHDQRRQLQSQIDTLDAQREQLRQAVSGQESTLAAMEQRLASERGQLRDFNASVESYMLDHKLAVAALVVGVEGMKIGTSAGGAYSDDAKQLADGLALVAAIYAMANLDEVTEVFGTMNKAEAHTQSLNEVITQTTSAIDTQRALVQQGHADLDRVAQREVALQQQLQAL